MAIMAIVFAVIVPQFRPMLSSWDSKAGAGEALQNGRVLIDHLKYNLSKAVKITDVSGSAVTSGYIEYEDNDGNTCRYAVASNYVEFGVLGDLNDLAGPVSQLQFTCYDACDFNTPITDVNFIRFVKVETTVTNADALGQNESFIAQAYLRANAFIGGTGASLGEYTAFEHDIVQALESDLAQVDANHYLCVYTGNLGDGYAVILKVDVNDTWDINTAGTTALEYDESSGLTPALAQIDSTHYLCAYDGHLGDGFAVVLEVDTGTWAITKKTPLEFDTLDGHSPALAKINSTHYLCAWTGKLSDGFAAVLEVDTGTWAITKKTLLEYDTSQGSSPTLAQIDSDHYLCVYEQLQDDGYAVVLAVDVNNTWNITKPAGTAYEYDILSGIRPALAQINSTHYLCAYTGQNTQGWAQVLTVDVDGTWDVNTAGTALNFDATGTTAALAQIDSTNYLCAYTGQGNVGYAVVLTVDTDTWDITEGTATLPFDATTGIAPALAEIIDGTHYLCAYEGPLNDGFAVVLNYTAGGGGTLMP